MAEYVKKLALDFNAEYPIQTVFAKQLDENSRFLLIEPQLDGEKIDVRGCSAKLYAERPDRTVIIVDGEITDEGNIYVELTSEVIGMEGIVRCDIKLSEDGKQFSSCLFHLNVIKSIGLNGLVPDPTDSSDHKFITVDLPKMQDTNLNPSHTTAITPYTANDLHSQSKNAAINNTLDDLQVKQVTVTVQETEIEEE